MAVAARVGGRNLPWQEVCASRFFFGGLTVAFVARAQGRSLVVTQRAAAWQRSILGTISAAGTFYLYATPHLPIGDAATLLATAPIFVAILGVPLLGERVGPHVAFALAMGFAGIALVAHPSFSSAPHLVAIGTGTAVISALAFLSLRRLGANESSEAVVFHFACVGTMTMAVLCIPVWQPPSLVQSLALGATGLFGGLAQIAMTRAYGLDRAARVSALSYSGVVFTRALAMPIFGEAPSFVQATGSLLVVAAGVFLALGRSGGSP